MKIFKLPDLGEGLPDAEIVEWHVKEGDAIEADKPLVSMETAKAVVEVPSPYTGTIAKLHGNVGDVIPVDAPLVEFDGASEKSDTGTVAGEIEVGDTVVANTATVVKAAQTTTRIKAAPAARAAAKRLGIDLARITGTGNNGLITVADVEGATAQTSNAPTAANLEPLRGVRRQMAHSMKQSHAEVVPVTVYDAVDITPWVSEGDITVRLIQAVVAAAKAEPSLNAWFHSQASARELKSSIDIGLAMDTADGLFVPVIPNAGALDAKGIRTQIEELKKEVSTRTVDKDKLTNPSITLSNFGKFAGMYASPIVVPPMVAIIAAGRLNETVQPINGDPMVRTMLPLSLTFDHRAVTGGEATRFLGAMMAALSKP